MRVSVGVPVVEHWLEAFEAIFKVVNFALEGFKSILEVIDLVLQIGNLGLHTLEWLTVR